MTAQIDVVDINDNADDSDPPVVTEEVQPKPKARPRASKSKRRC